MKIFETKQFLTWKSSERFAWFIVETVCFDGKLFEKLNEYFNGWMYDMVFEKLQVISVLK